MDKVMGFIACIVLAAALFLFVKSRKLHNVKPMAKVTIGEVEVSPVGHKK
jgi:hypothetical protein